MKRYGQFCSIALALEILGERWTLLVMREVLVGSDRFNDIWRGLPRISRTLLSKRLGELTEAGAIERIEVDGRPSYRPTQAGSELWDVLEGLGVWGRRWVRQLEDEHLDVDLLMWDMRRRIRIEAIPRKSTALFFHFTDGHPDKRSYWLRIKDGTTELCLTDPGIEVEVEVHTDVRTLVEIWYGTRDLEGAIRKGELLVRGTPQLTRSISDWIGLGYFASVQVPA